MYISLTLRWLEDGFRISLKNYNCNKKATIETVYFIGHIVDDESFDIIAGLNQGMSLLPQKNRVLRGANFIEKFHRQRSVKLIESINRKKHGQSLVKKPTSKNISSNNTFHIFTLFTTLPTSTLANFEIEQKYKEIN